MTRTTCFLLVGAALTAAACQPEADRAHDAEAPGHSAEATHGEAPHADAAHADAGHADAAHDAHGDGHGDAHGEALPLRPIMQRLGADMAGLTYALWIEDYEQMGTHAGRIAEHPHISDEELQRIRTTLGPEMDRFAEVDEAVHAASRRLQADVEARDVEQILQRLGEVQTGCASCHTQFRQRLRTDSPAP